MQHRSQGRKAAKKYDNRLGEGEVWHQRFLLEEGKYYQQSKEYDKALKAFRSVEKKGGAVAGEGAYRTAITLWEQNATAPSEEGAARALETLARFVQQYPDSPQRADAFLRLANYQLALHNYLQAAGAYKRVLDTPGVAIYAARAAIWKPASNTGPRSMSHTMCAPSPPVNCLTCLLKALMSARLAKRLNAFWSMPTMPCFPCSAGRSGLPEPQ